MPDSPGDGVAFTRVPSGNDQCDTPVTDGHGDWIGLGFLNGDRRAYEFARADGSGDLVGWLDVLAPQFGGTGLAPQPDGYEAIEVRNVTGTVRRYGPTGALRSEDARSDAEAIVGVPGGGSVVSRMDAFAYRLVWIGEGGDERAQAPMPDFPRFVVSATGEVLAFTSAGARWYGRDGAALTDWFAFDGMASSWSNDSYFGAGAVPLADGSVVVGWGGPAPVWFEAGSTRSGPPPDWMASRAGAIVAAVRGNRANAFARVTSAPTSPCGVEIEVLTPAGEPCGMVALHAPQLCREVAFGADRTVFVTGIPGVDDRTCAWRWWTGLLR